MINTETKRRLVNEWFPTGRFINIGIPFRTYSIYETELMSEFPLTGHALHKAEIEYHGKFGHTLGRILLIYIMS